MAIKLYWWRGEGEKDADKRNFGDYLSPLIVEMLAKKPVEFAPVERAEMMAIGTILKKARKARRWLLPRRLHVWGSGAGFLREHFSGRHFYHAVRGSFTRERIDKLRGQPALGDPGLLAGRYWEGRPRPPKKFALGVIPHFIDREDKGVQKLLCLKHTTLIDVFWPVEEVLKAIQTCEFIVSSSLHGLIVSDAFQIPNRRIIFSGKVLSDLKFKDYYSAFGLVEPSPLYSSAIRGDEDTGVLIGEYRRPGLEEICEGLVKSFPKI